MILAPWRRIERLLYPDAEHCASGSKCALCNDERETKVESPLAPSFPRSPETIAVDDSGAAALPRKDCLEVMCDPHGGDRVPLPETGTPFLENPAIRRLSAPSSLRIGESCATTDSEYREIFGPAGSIQRCVEQFIGARFSPRKAIRSDRNDRSPRDFGRSSGEPTDVCVVAGSRISHAA